MLTKGAIGNLVNRYKAVLKKCNLINTFGSLAVASMLVLGGAGVAVAAGIESDTKDYVIGEVKTQFNNGDVVSFTGGEKLDSLTVNHDLVLTNGADIRTNTLTVHGLNNGADLQVENFIAKAGKVSNATLDGGYLWNTGTLTAKSITLEKNLSNNGGTLTVDNLIVGTYAKNKAGSTLNINNSASVAEEFLNDGTINITGVATKLDSNVSGNGTINVADKATLALDADKDAVTIDNVVTNAGTISVADAAVFNKTIESKDGVINLADGAKLTVNADKKSGAILGDFTITGNGDVTLTGKNHVLSSTTGWDYTKDKGKAGAVDVNITANSLTIDSEGYGIQNIAGKHTITANTVDITASNGGHAIQVQGQPNAEVAINFGDGGFTALKKTVEGDDGHALYVLDSSDKSSSKLTIQSIEGTSGNAVITGDTRAAIAVMGTKAEASIQAGGNVTVSSSISKWDKSRKSAAVYVTGGKLDITAGETLTIKDNLVDDVNNAIGIAVGGEAVLAGKNVVIEGNVLSITPDNSEDDFAAKKPVYGTDADRDYTGKWLDTHYGKLAITADESIKIDGSVDIASAFTATAGKDIAIESTEGVALDGGHNSLTAGGKVNIAGATYGYYGAGGSLSIDATGDVNVSGQKTALYFAPELPPYADFEEAQKKNVVSIVSMGNVNIKVDEAGEGRGLDTRAPATITAVKDINITGKGQTALTNRFGNYEGNVSASTTTLNAGGNVTITSDIAEASTGTHYKEAALYTQAGTTNITAGGDITIADTGSRANKNGVSIRDNGTVLLDAGGNIAISGGVNNGTGKFAGGSFTAMSGGDITIADGKHALADRGTFVLDADGDITLGGSDNVIQISGASVALNAGGNVTIASTGADGIYFAPEPVNTLSIDAGGDVTIAAGGEDGYGIGNRGNVTIDGTNVTITGKGRTALADWTSEGMGTGNTTINATGAVTLAANILDKNLETARKNAVLYTQGNTVINGASIAIADTSDREDKFAVSVDGGKLTLNSGESINITGDVVLNNGSADLTAQKYVIKGDVLVSSAAPMLRRAAMLRSAAPSGITFNGGQAEIEGQLDADKLNLNDDAQLSLSGDDENFIGTVGGDGGQIIVNDGEAENKLAIGEVAEDTDVKVIASGEMNDATGGDASKLGVTVGGENLADTEYYGGMKEGQVFGAQDENGNTLKNTRMDAVVNQASVTTVALDKILTNDVRKRLGDIRSDKNQTGVWMRWDGGKLQGKGLSNDFNTIQIGGDTKVGKNCRLGVAGSFTHGDAEFAAGNAQLEGFSFATYATWMGENGMFADVVARLGHFSNEMNIDGIKDDMDNRVFSLSGEYGWRFDVCDQFFVEPQVELAYTYVSSSDLQLESVKYDVDSLNSFTGRLGLVAGWELPNDRGNVYARASVLQQFMGDSKITGFTAAGIPNVQETDGNDTWLEYGIGANVKLNDKTYIWADVERTEGADIEEEWRGTVGIRYSF